VENILKHDYLFSVCEIQFAEISHGLPVLAKCEGDKLTIYLRRKSNELNYLCEIYKNDYSLLEPLVKDYVRTSLYTKFSQYVPSSQKGGAEYMYKMLLQRKEDWSYESTEVGNIESVWDAYLHGKANMEEVAAVINRVNTAHTQTVAPNNIGNIIEVLGEQKLPQPAAPAEPNNGGIPPIEALPPIMRIDTQTNLKILVADSDEQRINGYKSFLALSDSVKNFYMDFFMQPHTTRIIWSMHRIIYIFTLLSGSLTLYYDMELKKKLEKDMTGGKAITTSTIITKNRIFVPIIPEMEEYFDIKEGNRKFVVRFDDIRS
jgi:molecular chaperone HtpG